MERILLRLLLPAVLGLPAICIPVIAQGVMPVPNRIRTMFIDQMISQYIQEKVYVHLDKNHYVSGDTIWLRAHKVNAMAHTQDTLSRYVYVELVDPGDSLTARIKIRNIDGVYGGYIPLKDNIAGGNYTLRAYTGYMLGGDEDYLYTTSVRVSNPYSPKVIIEPSFEFDESGRRISGMLKINDLRKEGSNGQNRITVGWHPDELRSYQVDGEGNARLPSMRTKDKDRNSLLVHYDNRLAYYIDIPAIPDVFDVSFFPEGGHLLAGTVNTVGFKALDSTGAGADVKGAVYDDKGNEIANFTTLHAGMGKFVFKPEKGMAYYAECRVGDGALRRFTLPAVHDNGVGLRVNTYANKMYVSVNSAGNIPAGGFLVIHVRGEVFFEGPFDTEAEYMAFDNGLLPEGVGHILFLDNDRDCNILSERLVYIDNGSQAKLELTSDKLHYGHREPVNCKISLADDFGNPLRGSFSVSVTDDNDIMPDYGDNIRTSFLLTSDLRGYIESPGWYFDPRNGAAGKEALDALMLTQGWRRYDMRRTIKGDFYDAPGEYELSQNITGTVKRLTTRKPSGSTEVLMISLSNEAYWSAATDDNGKFAFHGLDYPDSTAFFVQAYSRKNDNNVLLELDMPKYPDINIKPFPAAANDYAVKERMSGYIDKSSERWISENGMMNVLIEPVQIKAKRLNPHLPKYLRELGQVYDEEYIKGKDVKTLYDLAFYLPNVKVVQKIVPSVYGDEFREYLVILDNEAGANSPPPRFVINGRVERVDDWRNITMEGVESVHIVTDLASGLTGPRKHPGGAILINYKDNIRRFGTVTMYNTITYTPLGYQKAVEFYSPAYDTDEARYNKKSDLRTTLYWSPSVSTDSSGVAGFSFYCADNPSAYTVTIEGTTDDGRVIRSVERIDRR